MVDLPLLNKNPNDDPDTTIGGVPIGCNNMGGIYAGYTMIGGDDFNGPLDIVHVGNPLARYFNSRVESFAGARAGTDPNEPYAFITDQYCTGDQDSNAGVPIGTYDVLRQENSCIIQKARWANSDESPHIMGRQIVASQINGNGYLTVSPPCIIEFYSYGQYYGLNPTLPTGLAGVNGSGLGWLLNTFMGGTGGFELDGVNGNGSFGTVIHNDSAPAGGPVTTNLSGVTGVNNPAWHLQTWVMTTSSIKLYLDGVLLLNVSGDTTVSQAPFYFLTFNTAVTFAVPSFNASNWQAAGQVGATTIGDYYRYWVPTSGNPIVINPLVAPQRMQVNYGTSINYTFPSTASLWSSAPTSDYCKAWRDQDFEPGTNVSNLPQSDNYTANIQFPKGLSFNSSTRVLSGVPTMNNPGRLHLTCHPYLAGAAGISFRDYIDIGPRIDLSDFVLVNGTAVNIDLYYLCNCGTLSPGKVITCTGLPAWASFDGRHITGTPNANATTSITVGVTNAVGQSANKTVNMVVQASADAISIDAISTNGHITTSLPRDIIVAFVNQGGSFCPGITDTAGLTWTLRGFLTTPFAGPLLQIWYARASSAVTSNVVTPSGGGLAALIAINGINMLAPFDTNASLYTNSQAQAVNNGSGVTSLTSPALSTSAAKNIVIGFLGGGFSGGFGAITPPSGFTNAWTLTTGNSGGSVDYAINSSAVSGAAEQYSWANSVNGSIIFDALQGQI
jgi:Putative Ig domain